MHITKTKLKEMIREAVKKQLFEVFEDSESEDSEQAYQRFLDLKKKYHIDFWLLDKIGPELFDEIIDIRDESENYSEFYKKVGPGVLDRSKGVYERTNKFGMRAEMAHAFWKQEIGSMRSNELKPLKDEFEKLKERFKTTSGTTQADMVYGRKRTNVIDTETGKVISSKTDRKGSLGT